MIKELTDNIVISNKEYFVKKYMFEKDNQLFYFFITFKDENSDNPVGIGFSNVPAVKVVHSLFKKNIPKKTKYDLINSILTSNFNENILTTKLAQKGLYTMQESVADFINKVATLLKSITSIITIVILIRVLWDRIVFSRIESRARAIESYYDDMLFSMTQKGEEKFKAYSELINYITMIVSKDSTRKGLIIYGRPGTGKTFVVKRTLNKLRQPYQIFKGGIQNIRELYQTLFFNRNNVIVLDDIDTLIIKEDTINVLKAAVDTYSHRIVSMPRDVEEEFSTEIEYQLPSKFEFNGQVIIITNMNINNIDIALRSRCFECEINFDIKKMLSIIADMIEYMNVNVPMQEKEEVINYLSYLVARKNVKKLDFRIVSSIIDLRHSFPDKWKKYAVKLLT